MLSRNPVGTRSPKAAFNSVFLLINSIPDDISLRDKDSGWRKIVKSYSHKPVELYITVLHAQ